MSLSNNIIREGGARAGGDERGNDTHSLWSIGLLVPSLISFIIRGGNCEVSLMSRAGTTGNSDSLPQFARRPFSLPSVTHVLGRLRLTRAWRGKKEIHIIYATQWAEGVSRRWGKWRGMGGSIRSLPRQAEKQKMNEGTVYFLPSWSVPWGSSGSLHSPFVTTGLTSGSTGS